MVIYTTPPAVGGSEKIKTLKLSLQQDYYTTYVKNRGGKKNKTKKQRKITIIVISFIVSSTMLKQQCLNKNMSARHGFIVHSCKPYIAKYTLIENL